MLQLKFFKYSHVEIAEGWCNVGHCGPTTTTVSSMKAPLFLNRGQRTVDRAILGESSQALAKGCVAQTLWSMVAAATAERLPVWVEVFRPLFTQNCFFCDLNSGNLGSENVKLDIDQEFFQDGCHTISPCLLEHCLQHKKEIISQPISFSLKMKKVVVLF